MDGFARRALLIGVLTAALLALGVADASAVIVHVDGKTLSYTPLPASVQSASPLAKRGAKPGHSFPLEYHGGPVMPANTNYPLYWDPSGAPAYPAGYESGLNKYFEDLAHDSGGEQNTDSVLTQYGDSSGEFANYNAHFGGAILDTDPYPANGCTAAPICLTDEQLQTELKKYLAAHKLPTDLEHEYFMLTPPGVESCFDAAGHECSAGTKHAAYCAYHGDISVGGGVIVYAEDPYVDGLGCDIGEEHPNENPSDATIGGGLSHEHSESVTDPELDAWFDRNGEEVGDKCRTFVEATEFGEPLGKAPDGAKYNQLIDGDEYWYQQEWSNATESCQQRLQPPPPTVTHVAPKKGPLAGGTTVTIKGTNFTASATVDFGASPALEVTVNSSGTITAVSPPGTAGTVDITVTTAAGTSAVTKKDHFKYKK